MLLTSDGKVTRFLEKPLAPSSRFTGNALFGPSCQHAVMVSRRISVSGSGAHSWPCAKKWQKES